MQFKEAAYQILSQSGKPLHYNEITDRAIQEGILTYSGQTPHSTMGALLYSDTLKPDSRFRRGEQKGAFAIKTPQALSIQEQVESIRQKVRHTLKQHLLSMHPQKFEQLIQTLLEVMRLENTEVTPFTGDKGVDVRGILNAENLSRIEIAVQAKRWKHNVGSTTVQNLRGALKTGEHGIIITPSDFTSQAVQEASASSKVPISLVNGDQLADLLIKHNVGVKMQNIELPVLDDDYWSEIIEKVEIKPAPGVTALRADDSPTVQVKFPVSIHVEHKGQVHKAELLDLAGRVHYGDKVYETPSAAAKVIATNWKAVNGWAFWKYLNADSGKWELIGRLKGALK